jgi:hypothetical protein
MPCLVKVITVQTFPNKIVCRPFFPPPPLPKDPGLLEFSGSFTPDGKKFTMSEFEGYKIPPEHKAEFTPDEVNEMVSAIFCAFVHVQTPTVLFC